jgi:very-short-patch-repair endonuclease
LEEYDKKLKQPSRELRKNLTQEESLLWSKVREKQLDNLLFYRQKPIGGYIVDFYCPKAKLVIEIDGSRHFTAQAKEYDKVRDEFLRNMGLTVLRFTNSNVLTDVENVIEEIKHYLPV